MTFIKSLKIKPKIKRERIYVCALRGASSKGILYTVDNGAYAINMSFVNNSPCTSEGDGALYPPMP